MLKQLIPSRPALAGLLLACTASAVLAQPAPGASPASPADLVNRIKDGTVVAVSDGDFVGPTYATGRLTAADVPHRDLLTVLAPGRNGAPPRMGQVEVSNSVTAPPEVVTLTRDGRFAFVVERLQGRRPGTETSRELAPGRRLFAVDLTDRANPRIVDTVELPATHPEGVRVSPDGRMVAVVANTAEASSLLLVPFAEGRFGLVGAHDLARHGVTGTGTGPTPRPGGVTTTFVDWHPSGRFLAVNVHTQNRVAFFEILPGAGGASELRRWGNLVETGPDPFVGRFTPDGRHYLTADWGRDFAATTLDGRLPSRPSSVSVIRLAEPGTEGAAHARVGSAETDRSSEGLAVSPNGRLAATVNMRETATLPTSPRHTREASVTLLAFDPGRSQLTKVADYRFEGVLPEGAAFDAAGEHLLVTVFQSHEGGAAGGGGGLDVWAVGKGERPTLDRVGRIPMPHGVHHVETAP